MAVLLGSSALAQSPLTIIDWLGQPDKPQNLPETVLLEPPVTKSATQPEVQVTPLQALLPPIGLVSPAATGLQPLLADDVPAVRLEAAGALKVMEAEAEPRP